jgi:hypothetical protein
LVSERRDQFDLLLSEGLDDSAQQTDDPNGSAIPQQRNPEHRSVLSAFLIIGVAVLRVSQAIWYMNGAALDRGAANQRAPGWRDRIPRGVPDKLGGCIIGGNRMVPALL